MIEDKMTDSDQKNAASSETSAVSESCESAVEVLDVSSLAEEVQSSGEGDEVLDVSSMAEEVQSSGEGDEVLDVSSLAEEVSQKEEELSLKDATTEEYDPKSDKKLQDVINDPENIESSFLKKSPKREEADGDGL